MFLDCRFKLENKISVVSIHFYDVDKEPYVMEKLGLEQLCKVAVASTGGATGMVNVARILVNSGRPMFNVDTKTMQVSLFIYFHYVTFTTISFCQREMVTLCCAIELLPS